MVLDKWQLGKFLLVTDSNRVSTRVYCTWAINSLSWPPPTFPSILPPPRFHLKKRGEMWKHCLANFQSLAECYGRICGDYFGCSTAFPFPNCIYSLQIYLYIFSTHFFWEVIPVFTSAYFVRETRRRNHDYVRWKIVNR